MHVISKGRRGLVEALSQHLNHTAETRFWSTIPPVRGVRQGDIVVVDIENLPAGTTYHEIASLTLTTSAIVITGRGMVASEWLALTGQAHVSHVHCDDPARGSGYAPVITAVAHHLHDLLPHELASRVLARARHLDPASHLVALVCENPWGIRRPADLRRYSGGHLAVRRCLAAAGYRRAEHFITVVRALMVECLVEKGLRTPGAARLLAGIADASNFRRQISRAKRLPPATT